MRDTGGLNIMLTGNNIALRLLVEDDVAQVCEWRNMPENAALFFRQRIEPESFLREIQEIRNSESEEIFAIAERESGAILGTLSYEIRRGSGELYATLGIMIGSKYARGKGRGTEAISLITEYLYKNRGVKNIVVEVKPGNSLAIAFYEKLGFRTKSVIMSKNTGE